MVDANARLSQQQWSEKDTVEVRVHVCIRSLFSFVSHLAALRARASTSACACITMHVRSAPHSPSPSIRTCFTSLFETSDFVFLHLEMTSDPEKTSLYMGTDSVLVHAPVHVG